MPAVTSSAATPSPTATAHAGPGRLRGFHSGARELDDESVRVEGSLPRWLRGTLLLGGPALWDLPGAQLQHWFDGYAMWHAVRIDDLGARYRSRFARSDAYRRSLAAGQPFYGEFGSRSPAGFFERLRGPRITDNPAVVIAPHGSHWMAVSETPFMTRFDPDTLATLDRIELSRPDEAMHLMAAHGFTLRDGSYLGLASALGSRCELKLFRVAAGATRAEVLARIRVAKPGYTHGFALARGHAIVWETALRAQPLSFRFSARSYADNFRWEPRGGSRIHAIALDSGAVRSWRIPPMMAFHATQAWAEADGFVLDLATYTDGTIFDDLTLQRRRAGLPLRAQARHVRYQLREGRDEAEPRDLGHGIELQQVHPAAIGERRARVCWGAGGDDGGPFSSSTLRWDLDSGALTSWQREAAIQLEPLFVPRPGGTDDDDGVLLVPTLSDLDAATVIAVLDARRLTCLAELHAPQVVPFGFHAAFRPAPAA